MRLNLFLPALLAAALTACAASPTRSVEQSGDGSAQIEADAAACAARGGQLRPLGRLQRVQCVVPYADAGASCSSANDCSGQCLAATPVEAGTAASGQCQRDASETFGCRQRIEGGVAQGTICVD